MCIAAGEPAPRNEQGRATCATTYTYRTACQVSLFAGRRASDRVYLLLENWFVAQHLRAYGGTSAVLAVAHIDAVLEAQGLTPEQRLESGIGAARAPQTQPVMVSCSWHCPHNLITFSHQPPIRTAASEQH